MTLNNSVAAPILKCGIPQTDKTVLPLSTAIIKLFVDGYAGLEANPNAQEYQLRSLQICENCYSMQDCFSSCIDGDQWARACDKRIFGRLRKSVDLLVPVRTKSGEDKLLFVEGKLGCVVNAYTRKNNYPQWMELYAKYHRTRLRIDNKYPMCSQMIVIASQDALEQMRRRMWMYTQRGLLPRIECLCVYDFCERLSIRQSRGLIHAKSRA